MTQIKQAKIEQRKVADLTNWEDNPRSIVKEDFERLKKQIIKLGMYKPLLVNADNIVLGGNMRLRALTDLGAKEVAVTVVDATDPATMLEYALSDNDQVGVTDDLKLAELVHLSPIDTSLYKVQSNILRPLESIVNPPDPSTLGGGDDVDKSDLDESLDTYLNGNIKQIVLYYDNEQYGKVVDQLTNLGERFGIEDNTGIITKLIEDAYNA
ncbi:MAG: ParB N-terminal domain-containing protein [Candidatus Paceibacterota bacterium]|jgi:hypothetical protein